MKGIRTKHFFRALFASAALSVLFLGWMLIFGREVAARYFDGVTGCLFAIIALAMISFVAFCFIPYFHGDRRWFAIPSLLTTVFFIGTVLLWQVPIGGIGG